MFKKLACGLTAALFALALLAGCNPGTSSAAPQGSDSAPSQSESGGEATAPEGGGSFIIFQRKAELNEHFETLAKIYKAETGNNMEVWGDMGDGYINTLQGKLTSGFGPTIFTVRTGVETEMLGPYLTDLSGLSFAGDILNDLELVVDGEIVGIPYGIEGYGFMVNPELVDPASIKDYASFENALQTLSNEGIIPFELADQGFFIITHMLNVPFALQSDPFDFMAKLDAGEVKLAETPEFQEWAKYYEAIREYCPNPMEITYDQQIADFATGKAAMIHQGNWAITMFKDYTDMGFEPVQIPMPIAGNDALSVGIPNFFAINSQSSEEEQAAAREFLNWLFTSETGKEFCVNELQMIPTVKGMEAPDLDILSKQISEATQSENTLVWTYNYWPNNITANYLQPLAQEFFLDSGMTGQQFLEKLDEAWAQANENV